MRPTEESFLKDVSQHAMTIVRDDGVHRHLRFRKPETYNMAFDIITYPGYLVYSGDMGCYVFSRLNDMFEFFRTRPDSESNSLHINLGYWAEKLEATDTPDGHRQYQPDALREHAKEWLSQREEEDGEDEYLRERVEDEILSHADDGEVRALDALMGFEHEGSYPFQDAWECNFSEYTYRFVWCCYALAWAIRTYDAARTAVIGSV